MIRQGMIQRVYLSPTVMWYLLVLTWPNSHQNIDNDVDYVDCVFNIGKKKKAKHSDCLIFTTNGTAEMNFDENVNGHIQHRLGKLYSTL